MKHIAHIITGLGNGGAEAVLYRLCTNDNQAKHTVISLMDLGKYGPVLKEQGIEVHCLNMPAGRVTFIGLLTLYRLLKKLQPDVVQTWMYHADLIGGIVAKLAGVKKIYWNIRHSTLEKGESKKITVLVAKFCARLSRTVPNKIVCCAYKAVEVHAKLGYQREKMLVISNGYELTRFSPDAAVENALKKGLGLSGVQPILGMVGRFNPQKDHFGLLVALNIIKNLQCSFRFLLVGRGLNVNNQELLNKVSELNLKDNIVLLDQRSDIPAVMNALDVHVLSSSSGEAFPNVLAEAMACGTPCVTTDVGDAALIVGKTGWVVPPKNPEALAYAIIAAIDERNNNEKSWVERKRQCRERIADGFNIEEMIKAYHRVWAEG